jgi:hypothetical protein
MKPTLRLMLAAFAPAALGLSATVRYVEVNSTNATPLYTSRVTAARNIQDTVDRGDGSFDFGDPNAK